MCLRLVCCVLLLTSSLFSIPGYERMWERLLDTHTLTKVESGVPYVYVDYEALRDSQNFLSLKRVMNRMSLVGLGQDEALALLVNRYHVVLVEGFGREGVGTRAELQRIQGDARKLNKRVDFVLSDVNKYAPNMRVFSSVSPNVQLDEALVIQLQKMVRVDQGVKILRIHRWFADAVPDEDDQRDYLTMAFPDINLDAYSLHFIRVNPVSNVLKRKRR